MMMAGTAYIGGTLRGVGDVDCLIAAILADGASKDYDALDAPAVLALLREAADLGQPLALVAECVPDGVFREVLAVCERLGLDRLWWTPATPAQNAMIHREKPNESSVSFSASDEGEPVLTFEEAKQARNDGDLAEVVSRMNRCFMEDVPPLLIVE